mmetsp:Transcript_18/g.50  ORF Transcript_18/g.50 Transcript_18/m.50 type:complete len:507 (+) Transcript_18:55-1575(+)
MGHRHERKFSRRPGHEGLTKDATAVPPSDKKVRSNGQRQLTRRSDARASELRAPGSGVDFELRSSRNECRRGPCSRENRIVKLNIYAVVNYMFGAALISFAFFNFFILQSTPNVEYGQSNWSRRRMASFQSKAVPTDEKAELFIRTGQLPGANQMPAGSMNGLRKDTGSSKMRETSQGNREFVRTKSVNGVKEWLPISSLIDAKGDIAYGANISGLLDFSIIGFPKTGTTSVLRHLSDIANLLPTEHCDLVVNGTAKLVRDIYKDHDQRLKEYRGDTAMENQLTGIKCPQDISSDWSIYNYGKYFPQTKLVVGVRHPIFWFESLYNFRVSNVPWKKMPHTTKLTRGCGSGSQGVCAWRANFHDFLARLGKTSLAAPSELKLLSLAINHVQPKVGPVFIYDISQLSEVKFRKDLRDFLGLTKDIPPFPAIDTSGRFDHLMAVKGQKVNKKIDICDPEHNVIRSVLMKKASSASVWIHDYFLNSEDVFVSNRPYFEAVLKSWKNDPCG